MIQKRGKSYAVSVYDPSEKRKLHVGTRPTLKEARALERIKAEEFARKFRSPETIAEYAERWPELHPRPELPTNEQNRSLIKALVRDFGPRKLCDLGPREAREWALKHPFNAKVASAMYADAIRDELCHSNPFAKLNISKGRGRRDITPLTEEEVDALARSALSVHGALYGPTFSAAIVFAAYVGLRAGEMFGLRWDDVDLKRNEVRIERQLRRDGFALPKTKKPRTVILPPPAREAILEMPRSLEWLFTNPSGGQMTRSSHRYAWDPVRCFVGKPKLAWHCLRHFAGSHLADMGVGVREIAYQLGDTERVVEDHYLHTYEDRARERLKKAYEKPTPLRPVKEETG